ncbi:DMT family transporter [Amnibacterium setariae]|uniref:Multidrug DMT transporter permease n=1 Tax=Amnibacterium setariae TaxID=2306585 RepID=A0A3A1TV52_9MICO|nr:DMT family transporter [Amnibacterium setariae]RIX28133.1 multidrug DMT transporter permease [Amnibacterium setariae]
MPPVLELHLGPQVLNTAQAVGIPIALVGAVFLSFGAQFQSRGVKQVEARRATAGTELGGSELLRLIRTRSWLMGTVMLGLAIVLQLTSLRFAALIVVQPIGAIALVVTAILNARMNHIHLSRKVVRAIVLCVGGVAIFVSIAAPSATDSAISDDDLRTILVLLAVVLVVLGTLYAIYRARMTPVAYIVGAGILYGFVATMAKTVINRLIAGQFDWFTVLCGVGLLAAGAAGLYLVQTAYAVGPPDLVIAGLTVVDPIVAVGIGVLVLGEAQNAPWWAGPAFLVSGAIAVFGVFQLSRHHPEVADREAARSR